MIKVEFTVLDANAMVPRNAYGNDAGWDLFCSQTVVIPPWTPVDVRTGIAVAIPDGYYGRIVHRSSAPRKKGLMVLEGIIDAGFRGELFCCAWVWGKGGLIDAPQVVRVGESIAQLIVQKVEPVRFQRVIQLADSLRGEKGFGSSGA